MLNSTTISKALANNGASLAVNAEALIREQVDDQAVVAVGSLDLDEHARRGRSQLHVCKDPPYSGIRYWGGESNDELFTQYQQAVWRVDWQGQQLHVLHLEWETGCGNGSRDWVIASTEQTADDFILDVMRNTHTPNNSILVFSSGRWNRSFRLYDATQKASFDDLVLADHMKDAIRSDFAHFLESEERYNRLGIAWRRGALLIGPPGNGKTHCVRALVKELGIASLYVQSLRHHYYTAEQMWRQVFDRARGLRPCILVLEDLDSLVDDDNRSFFLNQLDGFEQNHGMIVLATTNHPERIDSAIMDRPSRFDRKYHFELPDLESRKQFLDQWQQQLASETAWDASEVQSVAAVTEGFSFAYLKELVISAVMKWMHETSVRFEDVIMDQARILQHQMTSHSPSPQQRNGRRRQTAAI